MVGVSDKVLGEEVKAVIVLNRGTHLDLDEVQEWVGQRLARFKVPTQLELRSELPHNAAGKVLKNLLRPNADSGPPPAPYFEEE